MKGSKILIIATTLLIVTVTAQQGIIQDRAISGGPRQVPHPSLPFDNERPLSPYPKKQRPVNQRAAQQPISPVSSYSQGLDRVQAQAKTNGKEIDIVIHVPGVGSQNGKTSPNGGQQQPMRAPQQVVVDQGQQYQQYQYQAAEPQGQWQQTDQQQQQRMQQRMQPRMQAVGTQYVNGHVKNPAKNVNLQNGDDFVVEGNGDEDYDQDYMVKTYEDHFNYKKAAVAGEEAPQSTAVEKPQSTAPQQAAQQPQNRVGRV
jgi:hypothetical protein